MSQSTNAGNKIGTCNECKKRDYYFEKELSECKYCHEFFCKEHLEAKVPDTNLIPDGKTIGERMGKLMHRSGGHNCPMHPMTKTLPTKKQNQSNILKTVGILLVLAIIAIVILSSSGSKPSNTNNLDVGPVLKNCDDGTSNHLCSTQKHLYCDNGNLVINPICGCPDGYKANGSSCEKLPICSDNTVEGDCSSTKPLFCTPEGLVNKSSTCGCPEGYSIKGDNCIGYEEGKKEVALFYDYNHSTYHLNFTVYDGVDSYLGDGLNPTSRDLMLEVINEPIQDRYLHPLVREIENITPVKDDQARIAIRLVQYIPFDNSELYRQYVNGEWIDSIGDRWPYQIIYHNGGICGDKSLLLAYLLRDLGYGVAIFDFYEENHRAVGIKCDQKYSYYNSGFCFVETTGVLDITNSDRSYGDLNNNTKLTSTPAISVISADGLTFDASRDYELLH